MKCFLLGLFLFITSFSSFASGSINCKYQMKACNSRGEHFVCVSSDPRVEKFCFRADLTQGVPDETSSQITSVQIATVNHMLVSSVKISVIVQVLSVDLGSLKFLRVSLNGDPY